MSKRFLSIWFPHPGTDWQRVRHPDLRNCPLVLAEPSHGKMIIADVDPIARKQGIYKGMAVADARAIIPSLKVLDHKPERIPKLLRSMAEWCIRFSPFVAADGNNGILIDATGCTHLWGGEDEYVDEIEKRFQSKGYTIRLCIADTIGAAWAMARYGQQKVVDPGETIEALQPLPPEALRLDLETATRLHKLGLNRIADFMSMPVPSLRRRFGTEIIRRIHQAFGTAEELFEPVCPVEPYQERLVCLDPISTAGGIAIALETSAQALCEKLRAAEKGLRSATFQCHRLDGGIEKVEISTSHPTHNLKHILKLFESKLPGIGPAEGIELFTLVAGIVEDHSPLQEKIWENAGEKDHDLSELIDRVASRLGNNCISRFGPDEHYWPERSYKKFSSLFEKPSIGWRTDKPRPVCMLAYPEPVDVTAPIPDYPPMLFRRKGKLHIIKKAEGPERIEQEWWLQEGQHRDYYAVEDEEGKRYWLFRSGHYGTPSCKWFLHGFFA